MTFPMQLFDAETIKDFGGEGNSRHMRISFCVTANSSSN
jgi:hypothetical protein